MRGSAAHTRPEPKYLFDCWPKVAKSVRSAARVALFLDFDGTLAPLRMRPEQVRMSVGTRRALERLVRDPRMEVRVLSGRRRADVEKRVAVRGVRCFGLHGWEGSAPVTPEAGSAKLLREARRQVRRGLAGLHGIWIEKKGPIFAVHARGAGESTARNAGSIVREVMRSFTPDLHILRGNHVWEITPPEMRGKGAAVRTLLGRMSVAPLALYLGDDTTDESAFSVLRHGITVVVGARRPTKATFALRGPREVRLFLEKLARELRRA
ncbi:MAG TPA: trehalose-phosphatase [Terriglobia bacterium]|nr:trehalose-phosphatase [Terriglobia bacterium]